MLAGDFMIGRSRHLFLDFTLPGSFPRCAFSQAVLSTVQLRIDFENIDDDSL